MSGNEWFLGRFAKLQKATTSFVMSACPSVCVSDRLHTTTQLPLNGFSWHLINEHFYENLSRENATFIKTWQRVSGTLYEDSCIFMTISRSFLLKMTNVSDKTPRERHNTHFMFNSIFKNFFRKACRLWDNVGKCVIARQATDNNTVRRMRTACWITKATDTYSEYVTFVEFTRQQWLPEQSSMLYLDYIARHVELNCNVTFENK
jgi:hypothetical protein